MYLRQRVISTPQKVVLQIKKLQVSRDGLRVSVEANPFVNSHVILGLDEQQPLIES